MKDKESSDNIPKRKIGIQTKWIVAIFLLGALILLPAILKFVFSINISSDWLGYYGTCLATIGTVFLGAVAVWQNSIIHKKEMAIQAKNAIEKISATKPLLKGLKGSFTNGTLRMNICIKNESNNVAKILKIHSAEIIDVANNIHCMDISVM